MPKRHDFVFVAKRRGYHDVIDFVFVAKQRDHVAWQQTQNHDVIMTVLSRDQ